MNKLFVNFLPPWVETNIQPAFYDKESGSVLQQTARMYAKVNCLVRMFNKLSKETQETVDEYIAKFVELKTFVDDYFENLDVQEEINNKLDQMTDDGTLQEIITEYIQANVAWTFDTVADMKASTNLIDGSYAKTLGYHSLNDEGGAFYVITDEVDATKHQETLDSGLYATLIFGEEVNVKQYGAYGDGTHDDTTAIQNTLNSGLNVYIPAGTYLVSSPLSMPFNISLNGESRSRTTILSTIENDFTIKYGSSYDYNGYKGKISNLKFYSENEANSKPYGIMLYSACTISGCEFNRIGKAIDRITNYLDLIKIEDTSFLYCVPNDNYIINLAGNADAFTLDRIKFAPLDSDTTVKNGIYITNVHGGSIDNSILNCNLTLDRVNAFSVNNNHTEGLGFSYYISNSNVSFNNCFKWKNSTGCDFILSTNANYCNTDIILNNFIFDRAGNQYNEAITPEFDVLPTNTTLHLNNVFRYLNFADIHAFSNNTFGIEIKNYTDFNVNSGKYSVSSVVTKTKILRNFEVNTIGSASAGFNNSSYQYLTWDSETVSNLHYRAIAVVDDTRKVLSGYSSDKNVGAVTFQGDAVALSTSNDIIVSDLYLFKGDTLDQYTKRVKVSLTYGRNRLIDTGSKCNMVAWEDVEQTNGRTGWNNAFRYEKRGDNVLVWLNGTPSYGTWTKYDRVINTNHTAGQVIAWEYDGTNWIAQGTY